MRNLLLEGWRPKPLWRVIKEEEDRLKLFKHKLENESLTSVERSTLEYHVNAIERRLAEYDESVAKELEDAERYC